MANVIITLPKELWDKIRLGEKQYELRKIWPRISMLDGRVFVVIKGTSRVAGWFSVSAIWETDNYNLLWLQFGKYLGISYDWYCRYVCTIKKKAYLWKIDYVFRYKGYVDLEEYFGVKHNPQSLIYTDIDPFVRGEVAAFRPFSLEEFKKSGCPLKPHPIF